MLNSTVLFFFALFISAQALLVKDSEMEEQVIKQRLETIVSDHHNAFEAFFAIEELRPYSIIQFDKTIDLYQNKWIVPSEYVSKLSFRDKMQLVESLTEFIHSLDGDEQSIILGKLNSWCASDMQMMILEKSFLISKSQILETVVKLDATKSVLDDVIQSGQGELNQLDRSRYDEIINQTKDAIASLDSKQQLNYYAEFYKHLSDSY